MYVMVLLYPCVPLYVLGCRPIIDAGRLFRVCVNHASTVNGSATRSGGKTRSWRSYGTSSTEGGGSWNVLAPGMAEWTPMDGSKYFPADLQLTTDGDAWLGDGTAGPVSHLHRLIMGG